MGCSTVILEGAPPARDHTIQYRSTKKWSLRDRFLIRITVHHNDEFNRPFKNPRCARKPTEMVPPGPVLGLRLPCFTMMNCTALPIMNRVLEARPFCRTVRSTTLGAPEVRYISSIILSAAFADHPPPAIPVSRPAQPD